MSTPASRAPQHDTTLRSASRALAQAARLRPPDTEDVDVERDLPMLAEPGVTLLADRWYPKGVDPKGLPIVLMRSPYGRRQLGLLGRLFAERGYQMVIQSCRGTFGSGGPWTPFRNERADGRATLLWLAEQPWWSGQVVTTGPSYLGLTQWALAADPPPALVAMAMSMTASRFRDVVVFPGGSFSLETGATWMHLTYHQELGWREVLKAQVRLRARLAPAFTTLPLAHAEQALLGEPVAYYQDWLAHADLGDPWWDEVDFSRDMAAVPPASLVAGWYDIFAPAQIDDFVALRAAGREARLTVGPWTHGSLRAGVWAVRDALDWFDRHVGGRPPGPVGSRPPGHVGDRPPAPVQGGPEPDLPVRVWVIGRRAWVDLPNWPPPAVRQRWYLQPGRGMSRRPPPPGPPDVYRYDPANPTPSRGGASLNPTTAGRRDQARREGRPDVLVYTSQPLPAAMTVAGPVAADIWFRSSVAFTDLFVRLCVVGRRGRSRNLSDGILRLEPAGAGVRSTGAPEWGSAELGEDGAIHVRVRMWPTAVTFARGERVRVQVSAGAHPLFARNLGGGEPLGKGTRLVPVVHAVFHDPDHPSSVELPMSSI